ncbi:MAG TPA: response regulator [Chloroflexota bacterium]|jgi:two-component system, OmpR family, KDP operon response regulator KdpE|nr:response regulator [Chloroflexota bacterium]
MEHGSPQRRTALVVDDDVFVLSAVADMLSEEGYDVHTASNGFSAMRQATELRPDVILLDLVLPERSGPEVLNELRTNAATRDAAVVVVSGHPDGLSDAQIADIDGLVVKPFDERDLLLTVHRAVQRAASRRAEVAPVAAGAHHPQSARAHRATNTSHTRWR